MATSLQTLVDRTRNYLRDTPDFDQITVSLSASNVSLTVADTTLYRTRWPIEVDYETMMIRSLASATVLTVTRGWRGAAAATHAANASVLVRPAFYAQEIIDSVNDSIQAMFPYVYKPIVDTSLTVAANQYQYIIPNMPGTTYPIPRVYRVEVLQPGDLRFRTTRRWEAYRGTVTSGSPASSGGIVSTYPVIQFRSLPPISSVIRVHGAGPMPTLTNLSDTLDPQFPPAAEFLIHKLAAGMLLASGEAGRDRADSGAIDRREEANRPGSSLQTASTILNFSQRLILQTAMPPLPAHIKAVI